MTTITLDIDASPHVGVAEAKTQLSGIVSDVQRSGGSYVIERYGQPVALVVPMPRTRRGTKSARGALHTYADPSKQAQEKGAFARAMEAKHGHAS